MILDCIGTYVSEIIAISALGLAFWQGWIARRHNKISAKPVLDSWLHTSESELHFWIQNKGLGTAEITSFDMKLGDLKFTSESLRETVLEISAGIDYENHIGELNSHGNSFISKDEKVDLVKIKFKNIQDASKINEHLESQFSLRIKYKSLYGDVHEYKIPAPEG